MNIRICGTGSALPERKITNDDLSQIMDTSDEWISSRTGIKARHLATEETTTSLAAEAAKKALADADMKPEEVELIIAATVTPDHLVPTLSCEVPVSYTHLDVYKRQVSIRYSSYASEYY